MWSLWLPHRRISYLLLRTAAGDRSTGQTDSSSFRVYLEELTSGRRHSPMLDFSKVLSQAVKDFFALDITEVMLQSFERIMHDIVVMDLLGRHVIAEF